MGIGRILAAGSALGATGVLIAAPIALAAVPSISMSATDVRPGSRVEITTECGLTSNFREPSAAVLENVKRVSYDGKTLIAKWSANVKKDAQPGPYEVSFACQDQTSNAKFAVSATGTEPTKPTEPSVRPTTAKPVPSSTSARPKPSTTAPTTSTSAKTPKGAPETGGGGTADGGGEGLAIAGGAVALAAGAGFGVWALRRRRASAQG
ncbi:MULTISPECIES: hypothetical protein [unclassified Crossiella]|uniref:hypothetical protein n=1 Tax=unclassified Crossiella TaxID=2620835 RepID=UPI0020004320|nr:MULTISPECIES: hypothetical protein [unclassified Crossiella]MCK2238341.1 hypothetical protein [Crossiella sp. S99.2]MCK2256381.1 hypothetical protein [Crossiella sp. S99.1]